MVRSMVAVAILAVGVTGCARQAPLPMEDEQFIEVMVSLRRASLETANQADFEARKADVLRQSGVTEEQLRAYARLAARDAPALSDVYDSIAARVWRNREPE